MKTFTLLVCLVSLAGTTACSSDVETGIFGGDGGSGGALPTTTGSTTTTSSESAGGANAGGANAGGANTGGANTGGANTGGANTGGAGGTTSSTTTGSTTTSNTSSTTSGSDCTKAGDSQACVLCFADEDPAGWGKFKGYALGECGCKNAAAPCNAQCKDNACKDLEPSDSCQLCALGLGKDAACVQAAGVSCYTDATCQPFLNNVLKCP